MFSDGSDKTQTFLCKQFFCKVYHVSPNWLVKQKQYWAEKPLSASPPEKRGSWNRNKNYKNKADKTGFVSWVKEQKVAPSHFTRRLDKKTVVYFVDFNGFAELWSKYKERMTLLEKKPISESEGRVLMKKVFKRRRFKKSHLDVCPVCLKLKNLLDRLNQKPKSSTIDRLLAKGTLFWK